MTSSLPNALPVDPVFGLILELPSRSPAPGLPRRLDELFRDLSRPESGSAPEDLEDMIWAIWASHEDEAAEEAMGAAIEAMVSGALKRARPLLDDLVHRYPDWAEAWNKRATLSFIEMRDGESLRDIARTLEIEPRHFGAISGFGQICLRHGRLNEARAAFQIALTINPHMQDLVEMLTDLAPHNLMLH